jgi:hypothetical protein
MAAASRHPLAQEGFANDPKFCACLRCALDAVGMASARAQDAKRGGLDRFNRVKAMSELPNPLGHDPASRIIGETGPPARHSFR